jgi:hypothetical protein
MSSNINWLPIGLMFLLPLAMGVGALRVARRFQTRWARLIARLAGAGMLMIFLFFVIGIGPYLWALHLESNWVPAHPKNRAELESYLSLYSKHEIQPSQSPWGNRYQLQSGERMIQYWLLYSSGAPLDVVYTTNDMIVAIYTSYE